MYEALLVVYLLVALGLVGLILIQRGKGADMGASFGAGASATVFGSAGSGNFLTRTTAILATIFFVLSLVLGNLSTHKTEQTSGFEDLSQTTEQTVPVVESVPAVESDVPAVEADVPADVPAVPEVSVDTSEVTAAASAAVATAVETTAEQVTEVTETVEAVAEQAQAEASEADANVAQQAAERIASEAVATESN